jgi:hypothetical protein
MEKVLIQKLKQAKIEITIILKIIEPLSCAQPKKSIFANGEM